MKTSELSGALPDYYAALALYGYKADARFDAKGQRMRIAVTPQGHCLVTTFDDDGEQVGLLHFSPSSKWAQGGPIIERERITIAPIWRPEDASNPAWCGGAGPQEGRTWLHGPTPLVAAMRAYVASKYGGSVSDDGGMS